MGGASVKVHGEMMKCSVGWAQGAKDLKITLVRYNKHRLLTAYCACKIIVFNIEK